MSQYSEIRQWCSSLSPETILPSLRKRFKVVPAVTAKIFFHKTVRRWRRHVCEEDGTAKLGRYGAFDCVQGVIDVWPSGWVEAVTYSVMCAGVGSYGPGPVVLYGGQKGSQVFFNKGSLPVEVSDDVSCVPVTAVVPSSSVGSDSTTSTRTTSSLRGSVRAIAGR